MPPKTRIRKPAAPIYEVEDGTDRVIKNQSGTKIARSTNTKARAKRKPSGKGDQGPPTIRARKKF